MFDLLSSIPTVGFVAGIAGAVGLVLFTVLSQVEEKSAIRTSLR